MVSTMTNEQQKSAGGARKDYFLPISIIVAAVLITGGIVWSTMQKSNNNTANPQAIDEIKLAENVLPVSDADHILGDKNAPVKIITFTDFECPFCKVFHENIKEAMAKYEGKVALVYRNFPLEQLHQFAQKEAESAECVAELGGNEKYWEYVEKIFTATESNDGLDQKLLPKFATELGIDETAFTKCVAAGNMAEKIAAQSQNAVESGFGGTPFSIIIGKNGKKQVMNGAYPLENPNPNEKEISISYILEKALGK